MIIGIIIPIHADTFEGSYKENYILLEITNGTAQGIVKIGDKINAINSDVKFYENSFKIKSAPTRLILFGSLPMEDNVMFKIFDIPNRQNIFLNAQKLDITPTENPVELTILEKYEQSLNQTIGMPYIADILKAEEEKRLAEEELKRIEEYKNRPTRSQYTQSDTEIVIVEESPGRIPYYKGFDFDILIIDPAKNPYFRNIHEDRGWIDGVEISAVIKDPFGKILKTFTGITEDKGTFSPDSKTFFNKVYTNKPYSLEINAKKYFDDNYTFTTASLLSDFHLYYPRGSPSPPDYDVPNIIKVTDVIQISDSVTVKLN